MKKLKTFLEKENSYRFIYKDLENNICGEVKNNRLIKYYSLKNMIEGNIYRAKVLSYMNSMNSFILDIGEFKNALLRKKETVSNIKIGDDIIVEVLSVPNNDKLIEVTQKYSLTDGLIVLLPFIKSKSNKIRNDKSIPYILRTRAKEYSKDNLDKSYNKLYNLYKNLKKEENYLPTPKLLLEGKFIREFTLDYDNSVISNYKTQYSDYIFDDFNPKYIKEIDLDYNNIKKRCIEVDGIEIVIDRLEALTVIDINSKNNAINESKEKMSMDTNIKSLEEICIQISLRDIKKMLLIDFIRINNYNKKDLINRFKEKLKEYNIDYKILGFSRLGLLEMIVY